ncbi:MAG: phosphoglycerate kinase [Planctomycetota bacterium]
MVKKLFIEDVELKNKRVLVRVDYNVPIDNDGKILDDSRIIESLKTIKYIIHKEGKPILITHLGRPEGVDEKLRLNNVASRLQELLKEDNINVRKLDEIIGPAVSKVLTKAKIAEVYLLENLRFDKGEEENSEEFAKTIASYADVYVNEAFSASHREHASIVGIPKFLLSCYGYNFKKEMDNLYKVIKEYTSPFYALIGGAKISDKIGVVTKLMHKCDRIFLGGALPFTIMKSLGFEVGSSYVESSYLQKAKDIYENSKTIGKELYIPRDFIYVKSDEDTNIKVSDNCVPEGFMGVDIGPRAVSEIVSALKNAKTVLWAGPLGIYEKPKFANSCKIIMESLLKLDAFKIGCGGDTHSMAKKLGYLPAFSYISTSGGAALEFIANEKLPGYEVLSSS